MKGQIYKALSGFYYVYHNGEIFQTRGRGNFRKKGQSLLVGDWVEFESNNEKEGLILDVYPRKNSMIRPAVANITLGVIVISAIEPTFSPNLLDRFLVTLEKDGIQPLIVITKMDLVEEIEGFEEWKKVYQSIGYPVLLSNQIQENMQSLIENFQDQLVVFMGQSGAGKSTLLNHLDSSLKLETGEISQSLGRGRHTTRHVELHSLYGGLVADTPGFSSIDFLTIDKYELPKCFPEFLSRENGCKFRECSHTHEPSCAIKDALEQGEIAQSRYDNYLQFLSEIEEKRPVYTKKKKGE